MAEPASSDLAASSAGPSYVPHLLARSGHTASFFGLVKLPVRLSGGEREKIPLDDGGSLVLHWWSTARLPVRSARPIVLLVHGINNSSDTPYLQYAMRHLEQSGLVAATANMRGHGHDNPITTNRFYTARADDDLRAVCEHIRRTRAPPALYAVGFSMGANQLLCFLGGGGGNALVDAAVAISCPFDLARGNEYLHHGGAVPRLYGLLIAQPLKLLLWHARHHLPLSAAQIRAGLASTSLEEFDEAVQVPLLGLRDVAEYYEVSSCCAHLAAIDVPLLVVHARDDPLIPGWLFESVAGAALRANPHATVVTTEHGGHIGWLAGKTPIHESWTDRLCSRFFERQGVARAKL